MIKQILRRPEDDLIAAVAGAIALAFAIALIPVELVRVLLSVPLALLLPGYAIARAIFVRTDLELTPRVMLVPALGLGQLVIGGLVLNFVPGGIQRTSWLIWLVLVVIAGAAVANARRQPEKIRGTLRDQFRPPNLASLALYVLAAAVAVLAMVASRRPESARNALGYARLTLAPADHNRAVALEVLNGDQHSQSFTLAVTVDSAKVLSKTVALPAGAKRSVHIALPPSATSRRIRSTLSALNAGAPASASASGTARQANLLLPPAFG